MVDLLIQTNTIELKKKGFHYKGNAELSRYTFHSDIKKKLKTCSALPKIIPIHEPRETIRLSKSLPNKSDASKSKILINYYDTPDTEMQRQNIELINFRLANSRIETVKAIEPDRFKNNQYSTAKHLYRVFNNGTFEQGGRFYGGWWQIVKKHVRTQILIDGEKTVEVDFRGFNPSALLALDGQEIPEDPYALIEGVDKSDELRKHAKKTMSAIINSKTGRTKHPKQFDEAKFEMSAKELQSRIHSAFPMIKKQIGTNLGLKLMRRESDIAETIMLHFVRQDHTILPVHDSFIVQKQLQNELEEVMIDSFMNALGKKPHVSFK